MDYKLVVAENAEREIDAIIEFFWRSKIYLSLQAFLML